MHIPSRIDTIQQFKASGGQIAAVLPIHYNRALLRAFDILPVEVWGPPQIAATPGGVHLQAYVCSICHNALAYLQQGHLEITDLILVPHACDSLQGLGSLLIDFVKPRQPVIPVYIPRETRPSDLEFLANELRAIYQRLAAFTSKQPDDASLLASITREENADQWLLKLHQSNRYLPMSNTSIYRVIRSREYLPAETFAQLAEATLATTTDTPRPGTPILMEGIVPEPMDMLETLTEFDAALVGDDLASCSRRLYPQGTHTTPFERMAERILAAPPDPTRGSPISERIDYIVNLAENTGAQGVIFNIIKFCEPELFDLPILRQELRQAGLPSIIVEVEMNTRLSQQIRTRLGAFLEMIQ